MPTALLFPGQGAPATEWRAATTTWCPDLITHARSLLEGEDPFEHFGEGTQFDQPAIYCASIAAFEAAGRPRPDFHAGHSMGELAALACAGAISEHDGIRIVVERGRLMAAAGAAQPGSMLAVRGGADAVAAVARSSGAAIANLNSPSQTVLSGPLAAIETAESELSARGLRTKRLAVTGAFHSPAMAPAAADLRRFLDTIDFAEPTVPVLSGRSGRPFSDPASELADSLLEPVLWVDVVENLDAAGVSEYLEIGPGKALTGLVRRIVPGAQAEPSRPPEPIGV